MKTRVYLNYFLNDCSFLSVMWTNLLMKRSFQCVNKKLWTVSINFKIFNISGTYKKTPVKRILANSSHNIMSPNTHRKARRTTETIKNTLKKVKKIILKEWWRDLTFSTCSTRYSKEIRKPKEGLLQRGRTVAQFVMRKPVWEL